jgi:hypothetical protein
MATTTSRNTQNWIKTESKEYLFHKDSVINNVINENKDKPFSESEQILKDTFQSCFERAKSLGVEIFDYVNNQGFECKTAYLKIISLTVFNVNFIISSQDFLKDSFREIYKEIRIRKKEYNKENNFHINFGFIPANEKDLNTERLSADGYILRYHG